MLKVTLTGHKNAKNYLPLFSKPGSETQGKEEKTKVQEFQKKEVLRIRLHEGRSIRVFFSCCVPQWYRVGIQYWPSGWMNEGK